MTSPVLAERIEHWPVERLAPYERNPRTHSDAQVAQIASSIVEFGFLNPILVDSDAGIVAGHGRLLAAKRLGLREVPVVILDHFTETQKRAYIIADNRLAEAAGWDESLLAEELAALARDGFDLSLVGFEDEELRALLASVEDAQEETAAEEQIPEAPAVAVTQPGDVWLIGPHRLTCGDCRDEDLVRKLLDGRQANVVITSPPYATQREYDPTSGFKPIRPEEYVAWYQSVAAMIESVLAEDGSYFLNIKEHADEGQRNLYVKDLVIAHVRQWGWRFVDELCWRKTDNGVPGGWNNRFKNAWEPVFHFCREPQIKFRPHAVGHVSEDCFEYSPERRWYVSAGGMGSQTRNRENAKLAVGIARPSNVIEAKTESSQGSHSAPFPRVLVEFFVKAYSDPGDLIFDPFSAAVRRWRPPRCSIAPAAGWRSRRRIAMSSCGGCGA
ncbi:MAG: ParB N-terminal domain-containing protein [Bryobacteraceae bacterium]|nr:ParB N-terminal domain-containing protein [Bryobacteraceae bacterium]